MSWYRLGQGQRGARGARASKRYERDPASCSKERNGRLCSHPDGDLLLLIEPVLSSGFQVDGFEFLGTLRVTKSLANRGGVVEIDVPRGKVKVRIPAGASAGTRLRLRGQGLENPETGEKGDVMLNLRIGR